MSVQAAEGAETLARHDSLYGDAEKVCGDRRHGSGVSNEIIHHPELLTCATAGCMLCCV